MKKVLMYILIFLIVFTLFADVRSYFFGKWNVTVNFVNKTQKTIVVEFTNKDCIISDEKGSTKYPWSKAENYFFINTFGYEYYSVDKNYFYLIPAFDECDYTKLTFKKKIS